MTVLILTAGNADASPDQSDEILVSRPITEEQIDLFFEAVVQSTRVAILNNPIANTDMTGHDGNFDPMLLHEELKTAMGIY